MLSTHRPLFHSVFLVFVLSLTHVIQWNRASEGGRIAVTELNDFCVACQGCKWASYYLHLLIAFLLFASSLEHSTYWGQRLGLTRFCFVCGMVESQSWLEPLVTGLSRNSKNRDSRNWGNEITGYNSTGNPNARQRDIYRSEGQHFSGYSSAVSKLGI